MISKNDIPKKDTLGSKDRMMSDSKLEKLGKLIGAWEISGDATGIIKYEVAEGGFFLTQQVDLEYSGRKIKGLEIIGRTHRIGEEISGDIWSRFYSFFDGLALDYVYDMTENVLTIWFGSRESNNFMKSTYSLDGNTFSGSWQWPGGGYSFNGKRLG